MNNTLSSITPIVVATSALFFSALMGNTGLLPDIEHNDPFQKPEIFEIENTNTKSSLSDISVDATLIKKITILNQFMQKLSKNSKDLEPDIIEIVNDHFWELF